MVLFNEQLQYSHPKKEERETGRRRKGEGERKRKRRRRSVIETFIHGCVTFSAILMGDKGRKMKNRTNGCDDKRAITPFPFPHPTPHTALSLPLSEHVQIRKMRCVCRREQVHARIGMYSHREIEVYKEKSDEKKEIEEINNRSLIVLAEIYISQSSQTFCVR